MQRRRYLLAVVVAASACGYPRLPAVDDGGAGGGDDDAPGRDAGGDGGTARQPAGARLWLEMETPDYADSAGGHVATCAKCPVLVAGKFGGGYQFDGTSVLTISAATDIVHGTAFTLAAWVKVTGFIDINNPGLVVSKQTGPNQGVEALLVQHNQHMGYYTTPGSYALGSSTIPLGEWHHFAFTWDGATKRGYIDGMLDAMQAMTTLAADDAAPVDIGGDPGAAQLDFVGVVDDVVFFDRVLSAAELAQLIAGPAP